MTTQQNNILAKLALLFSGIAIFACFVLLISVFSYAIVLLPLGIIFAIPNFLAINKYRLYRFALTTNLVALMTLVILASAHLWQNILNHTNIDLISALLMLVLILVLALIWQLLSINFTQDSQKMNWNELINHIRKQPSVLIAFSIGLVITDFLMLSLSLLPDFSYISAKIIDRGIIPPITLAIFFWGFFLIVIKAFMFMAEKQPTNQPHLQTLYNKVDNTQSDKDKQVVLSMLWNQFESFYTLPHYINWTIPILGFIGTVLGISLATEQLGIALSDNIGESGQVLSLALTPLGIAFDTTLIALSLSIILALLQTLLYRSEANHLRTLEEKFK